MIKIPLIFLILIILLIIKKYSNAYEVPPGLISYAQVPPILAPNTEITEIASSNIKKPLIKENQKIIQNSEDKRQQFVPLIFNGKKLNSNPTNPFFVKLIPKNNFSTNYDNIETIPFEIKSKNDLIKNKNEDNFIKNINLKKPYVLLNSSNNKEEKKQSFEILKNKRNVDGLIKSEKTIKNEINKNNTNKEILEKEKYKAQENVTDQLNKNKNAENHENLIKNEVIGNDQDKKDQVFLIEKIENKYSNELNNSKLRKNKLINDFVPLPEWSFLPILFQTALEEFKIAQERAEELKLKRNKNYKNYGINSKIINEENKCKDLAKNCDENKEFCGLKPYDLLMKENCECTCKIYFDLKKKENEEINEVDEENEENREEESDEDEEDEVEEEDNEDKREDEAKNEDEAKWKAEEKKVVKEENKPSKNEECTDRSFRCAQLAQRGFCSNRLFQINFKRRFCAKTCNLC